MTNSKVADYINSRIELSDKSQSQIAAEAGFNSPNMMAMIKSGKTKLPISRVPALAAALECSAPEMFRLAMQEYAPDVLKVTDEIYEAEKITKHEREILERIRALSGGKTIRLTSKNTDYLDDFVKASL